VQYGAPTIPLLFETERFGIRPAQPADAAGIAIVQAASWRSSYRGLLPDAVLDGMDAGARIAARRRSMAAGGLTLVAYDLTHGDVVGYCQAGPSRRFGPAFGELYEIYLVDRAKRFGLGRELFAGFVDWCEAGALSSMVVWVLEDNRHARRFYEALGGRSAGRLPSTVGGFGVIEVAYVWDQLPRI
jgi:GNAT superfamily N-acetyltransferase